MQTPYVLRQCRYRNRLLNKAIDRRAEKKTAVHEDQSNKKSKDPFGLVGECYVHGKMDGDLMNKGSPPLDK
jgi:hypothetical protein